ncbi:MAG TPA: helix-turn-helix domain-containing protein [Solirubrobacteraceae bacterium]|nr:helix-turn-helix domain-containing protein [Solirubrobacteraceae bacterium]
MVERSHKPVDDVPPWAALEPPVAAALRPVLPALVEEVIEAVRAVPAYATGLRGSLERNVRLGVEQALAGFLELIASRGEAQLPGREVYERLGRGELDEGRSLESLLAAYRAGARVAWRRLAEAGERAGLESETLVTLAEAVFAYIDELSAATADGYAQAQSAVAGRRHERRRALLELVLRDPPAGAQELADAARAAGWEPPARAAVLVIASDRADTVAGRLAEGVLTRADGEVMRALVPDPEGPGRRAELAHALRDTPAVLGPTVPLADARHSAQRAQAAFDLRERLMGTGERGLPPADAPAPPAASAGAPGRLLVADDHLPDLLLAAQPRLAADLLARRLGPLDALAGGPRERLLVTLGAWLDHLGQARLAADALTVHVQTVRYRLGQLRELLGDDLDDPAARLELSLALRARGLGLGEGPSEG